MLVIELLLTFKVPAAPELIIIASEPVSTPAVVLIWLFVKVLLLILTVPASEPF